MPDTDISADTTDLTVINGVGDAVAEQLHEDGFETVGDVGSANTEAIAAVDGIGETTATDIKVYANGLAGLNVDASSPEDDLAMLDPPFIVDTTDGVEYTVTIDAELLPYVLHVVLEEAVSQHQSNDFELRDEALNVASALQEATLSTAGPQYTFRSSESALTTFYRAVKAGSAEYHNRRGVTQLYGSLEQVADQLNEHR